VAWASQRVETPRKTAPKSHKIKQKINHRHQTTLFLPHLRRSARKKGKGVAKRRSGAANLNCSTRGGGGECSDQQRQQIAFWVVQFGQSGWERAFSLFLFFYLFRFCSSFAAKRRRARAQGGGAETGAGAGGVVNKSSLFRGEEEEACRDRGLFLSLTSWSCGVVGPPSQFPYRCERGEVEDWKCRKRRRDTVGVVALPGGVWSTSPVVSGRHVSPL
jgi:hypothetical protein